MSSKSLSAEPVGDEELARSRLYRLLGHLLAAPPDLQLLQLPGAGDRQGETDTPLVAALGELGKRAETSQPEQLKEEYFNLFIGLGRGELMPYASWYVNGALMERTLASLRQDLKRLGITRCEDVAEPEDHVAAVCETMGMIISDSGLCFEQAAFYQAYVGSWLDRFFSDLETAESAGFYRSVGRLGSRFMVIENEYFSLP